MKRLFVLITAILMTMVCIPQTPFIKAIGGRGYVRDKITEWGACRNVAITEKCGNIVINGQNDWAAWGTPPELETTLHELKKENPDYYLKDVHISEEGNWIILYDKNSYKCSGVPGLMRKYLDNCQTKDEEVTSVTFNEEYEWIITTTNRPIVSHKEIAAWLQEGADRYGALLTTSITDRGWVACFEHGFKLSGDLPSGLKNRIADYRYNIYRVKFAGDAFFFADKEGHYGYRL